MEPRGVNPWKLTAIAMALVMATALITGLVVANWSGGVPEPRAGAAPAPAAPKPVAQAAVPTPDAIAACNRQAASQAGPRDKTLELSLGRNFPVADTLCPCVRCPPSVSDMPIIFPPNGTSPR